MKGVEERVLEAARNLLVKYGYVATTTKRIADEAGVNEVTLFRRYKTKENLIKTAIEQAEKNALETLDSILHMNKEADIRSCLRTIGHNLLEFHRDRNDLMILQLTEGFKEPYVAKNLSSIPQRVVNHLTEYFEEQIQRGKMRSINPKNAALMFMSYVSYCQIAKVWFNDEFSNVCEKGFDDFLDVFIGGITKSESLTK